VTRILVVDDDELVRDVVVARLTAEGYEVRTAEDGEAGLAAALADPPDLVILDSMMPKLAGPEVCRRLRDEPSTTALPVIMLTARSQEADVQHGFAAGADDYIVKPFSPRELTSRVQAVLAAPRRARRTGPGTLVEHVQQLRADARARSGPGDGELLRAYELLLDGIERELADVQRRLDDAAQAFESWRHAD